MLRLHRRGGIADRAEAENIARSLLSNPNLPLVFRARACMILGCSSKPGYVEWAEEAVRLVRLGLEHAKSPGDLEMRLLEGSIEIAVTRYAGFQE